MLSFCAGVMIFLGFVDIIPVAIEALGYKAHVYFFAGAMIFFVISFLVPEPNFNEIRMTKVGMRSRLSGASVAIALSLHNFPEGMGVYLSSLQRLTMGISFAISIAIHNIPEGMAVAAPIYSATKSKWQAMKWTIISALCQPIGALIFGVLFSSVLTENVMQSYLAGVAGIMILISLKDLVPSALEHLTTDEMVFSLFVGMATVFTSTFLA